MSHDLLNHPEVLKTIRAELLRGGYPKEAIDDGVGEVVVKVFAYLREERLDIETIDRMQAIVRPKSYQHGVDGLRGKYQHGKCFGPNVEDANAHPAPSSSMEDRLDAKRAVEVMRANMMPREHAILAADRDGVPQKVTAERLNLSHDQLRKEKGKMLERHRGLLMAAGLAAVIAMALVIIFRMRAFHDEEAQHPPQPAPSQTPPPPPQEVPVALQPGEKPAPTPEDKQKAAVLRTEAHALALHKKWQKCSYDYDDADGLDPDGATPEQVKEGRLCTNEYLASLSAKP